MPSKTPEACPKDCTYNIHSKNHFINHWGFMGCIIVFTAISIVFFVSYNNSYKKTQQEIVKLHEQYCAQFSPVQTSDSLVIYKDLRPVLDSYKQSISDHLDLQYNKIQNDYAILTTWASALMIIFLIFSIYSMFKIDEIQKQSRESLRLIDETYAEVRKKSDSLDETMSGATKRIEGTIEQKISEFTLNIQKQSNDVEKQIAEYKKAVEKTASDNQKLFESFYLLLKGVGSDSNINASDSQK